MCVSTFASFNLYMFTKENGTTINNEEKRILNKKKCNIYSIL